jgi:hypothetical protein
MEQQVRQMYVEFDQNRNRFEAEKADLDDLKTLEERIKKSNRT